MSAETLPASAKATRILIASAVSEPHRLIRFVFARTGLESHVVDRASRVLGVLRQMEIALIVVEQSLPDLTGMELCRSLQGNPLLRHVPRLMLVRRRKGFPFETARHSGVDDFVHYSQPDEPALEQHRVNLANDLSVRLQLPALNSLPPMPDGCQPDSAIR